MLQNSNPRSSLRRYWWLLFGASAIIAITWFFVPAFIIQPFRHQTPAGLALAIARHRAPWVTLVAAFVRRTHATCSH
jgi:hypothetical protein